MKPKCSLNIVKVTADPGFEFLCCLKCFNSINNQNSSSRHQSKLKSHNLSLLQALLFHWVSKRQGGRLWSDLGKMKILTKLQFNQIESSALMAQSRSEPPPESDFSESFFQFELHTFWVIRESGSNWSNLRLNMTISGLKGWKATKYPMFTLILQCACH